MNKIDTDYKSLNEIDPEIVRFYSEDVRTRVTGHTEPDENGTSEAITEEYTVIVLNKPNEVHYDYVESRRGRRLGDDVIKAALVDAIAWEDFEVNHDAYLYWLEEYRTWEIEQPTETIDDEEVLVAAPERPVINMAERRAVYFQETESFDSNLETETGEPVITYDDENFVKHTKLTTTPKPADQIAEYHRGKAKEMRENLKLANIFVHGHHFQVRQEDRNNMDETIAFAKRHDRMGDMTGWITADNEPINLTFHQLEAIKDAYVVRMEALFQQYAAWGAGDMQKPFEFVEASYD